MNYDGLIAVLMILGFLAWVATYALIIKRGFQDKACGMPIVALCANISWEFIFGFLHPDLPPMNYINMGWCIVDIVIIFLYLRYGWKTFSQYFSKPFFFFNYAVVQTLAFLCILTAFYQFQDLDGSYTAYADNIMMSGLFIYWALGKENVDGQSLYIGLAKLVGTLFISIAQYQVMPDAIFLNYAYVACFVLDSLYVGLLYSRLKSIGIQPWQRV